MRPWHQSDSLFHYMKFYKHCPISVLLEMSRFTPKWLLLIPKMTFVFCRPHKSRFWSSKQSVLWPWMSRNKGVLCTPSFLRYISISIKVDFSTRESLLSWHYRFFSTISLLSSGWFYRTTSATFSRSVPFRFCSCYMSVSVFLFLLYLYVSFCFCSWFMYIYNK